MNILSFIGGVLFAFGLWTMGMSWMFASTGCRWTAFVCVAPGIFSIGFGIMFIVNSFQEKANNETQRQAHK